MTDRRLRFRGRRTRPHRPGGRSGFTLTELLVVISIIVLMLALAVPLFNVMQGGQSVDAGQNIVSAMLQRARARAIGLQERRGIFFFDDQTNGKTGMLMVKIEEPTSGPNANANVLELDQDNVEVEFLPKGIGAAFVLANTPDTIYKPCGLIVFDGLGRIEAVPGYTPVTTDTTRYPKGTFLSQQYARNLGANVMDASNGLGVANPVTNPEFSETALVLYDHRAFAGQPPSGNAGVAFGPQQSAWLDQNGVALVVNRYNGTLIRGD